MKITDIITEDMEGSTADYQRMLNFVRNSKIQGVPADQQVAVALYRELEKQQAKNAELGAELSAAEKRIDVATQGSELQQQQLGKHATELEKERGNIAQQQAAMGKLDAASAEREKASRSQLKDLTDKLEAVKSKPGVDPEIADKLTKQIRELEKKGVAADQVDELKRSIEAIQQQKTVDVDALTQLEQQLQAAQDTAQAVQSKMGNLQNYEKEIAALKAEVDSLESTLKKTVEPTLQQQQQQLKKVDQATQQLDQKIYASDTVRKATSGIRSQAMSTGKVPYDTEKLKSLLPTAQQQQQQLELPIDSDETQQQNLPIRESIIRWATGK